MKSLANIDAAKASSLCLKDKLYLDSISTCIKTVTKDKKDDYGFKTEKFVLSQIDQIAKTFQNVGEETAIDTRVLHEATNDLMNRLNNFRYKLELKCKEKILVNEDAYEVPITRITYRVYSKFDILLASTGIADYIKACDEAISKKIDSNLMESKDVNEIKGFAIHLKNIVNELYFNQLDKLFNKVSKKMNIDPDPHSHVNLFEHITSNEAYKKAGNISDHDISKLKLYKVQLQELEKLISNNKESFDIDANIETLKNLHTSLNERPGNIKKHTGIFRSALSGAGISSPGEERINTIVRAIESTGLIVKPTEQLQLK